MPTLVLRRWEVVPSLQGTALGDFRRFLEKCRQRLPLL